MCISCTTRRMTAVGQGEPAMIPYGAKKDRIPESGMLELGDEHVGTPCSAVQRSRATASSTLSASNPSEAAHWRRRESLPPGLEHHAETVIERYRNTHRSSGSGAALADEETVVHDIEVGECAPFGVPVVPLVNWMLKIPSASIRSGSTVAGRHRRAP